MAINRDRLPVRLRLRLGRDGTKKLVAKYGDPLECVRYRYNERLGRRYETVELIEEESAWRPTESRRAKSAAPPAPTDRMGVRIGYEETELRDRVKAVGGIWRPRLKRWELSYAQITALGLEHRLVPDR